MYSEDSDYRRMLHQKSSTKATLQDIFHLDSIQISLVRQPVIQNCILRTGETIKDINPFMTQTGKSPMVWGGINLRKTQWQALRVHICNPRTRTTGARGIYIQSYSQLPNEFKGNLEYVSKPYDSKRNESTSVPYATKWVQNNENTFQLSTVF